MPAQENPVEVWTAAVGGGVRELAWLRPLSPASLVSLLFLLSLQK